MAAGSGTISIMAAALESALQAAGPGLRPEAEAVGAVRAALAAAGDPAALGERERARLGAFLRNLAAGPEEPAGPWRSLFLEGPPDLAFSALTDSLAAPRSVPRLGDRAGEWGLSGSSRGVMERPCCSARRLGVAFRGWQNPGAVELGGTSQPHPCPGLPAAHPRPGSGRLGAAVPAAGLRR